MSNESPHNAEIDADSPECPEDGLPCSECGPSYCWASYPEHATRPDKEGE